MVAAISPPNCIYCLLVVFEVFSLDIFGYSIVSSQHWLDTTLEKYRVVVATLPLAASSLVGAEQTPSPEATAYGRPGE